jgi:hypothetical protein
VLALPGLIDLLPAKRGSAGHDLIEIKFRQKLWVGLLPTGDRTPEMIF